jgi:hypothetical protein
MCSTLKSQENIQKAYMEKETETEIKYFIKEKKRKREIYTKNGIVNTKTQKETSKHRSRKNKKKNSTPQISTEKQQFKSKKCQYWSSQTFTEASPTRAADSRNPDRFKISDNSPQVSDFHFHISTLILRVLSAQTGVPALFKMLNSQKHPGTICQSQQLEIKKPRETTTKHNRK